VRLVYMDEAGISNPEQEPFVVVSGVIVDADKKLIAIERHLDTLVRRWIPAEHQDGFIFHAMELFNGGGKVFKRDDPDWPLEKRLEIADCLAAIPKKFKLPLTFGWVERKDFPKTFDGSDMSRREKTLGAHLVSFTAAAMQTEMWVRQNASNEVCVLVVENNDEARRMITETQITYKSEASLRKAWGGELSERERKYFPFRKIKQNPLFEPKTPASVLQLADFCAYVFKKWLMRNRHYDRFLNPLRAQFAAGSIDLPWLEQAS
jgi:Protein of unknown function (DUF3800)